jgi:hypothetical protein
MMAMTHSDARPWRDHDFSALKDGLLCFYVGAGLSMATGIGGWSWQAEQIDSYKRERESFQGRPPNFLNAEGLAALMQEFISDADSMGVRLLSRDSKSPLTFGRTVLLNILLRHHYTSIKPILGADIKLQRLLWRARCHGILTTNYDVLIERGAPAEVASIMRVYRYTAHFTRFIRSNPRFVLKLHGDINDIATMVFDPQTGWDDPELLGGAAGEDLRTLYRTFAASGHLVYLGCGFRDRTIKELDEAADEEYPWQRIAVVTSQELEPRSELTKLRNAGLYRRVTFLSFNRDDPEDLQQLLKALVQMRRKNRHTYPRCDEAAHIRNRLECGWREPRSVGCHTEPWTLTSKPCD